MCVCLTCGGGLHRFTLLTTGKTDDANRNNDVDAFWKLMKRRVVVVYCRRSSLSCGVFWALDNNRIEQGSHILGIKFSLHFINSRKLICACVYWICVCGKCTNRVAAACPSLNVLSRLKDNRDDTVTYMMGVFCWMCGVDLVSFYLFIFRTHE